MVMNVRNVLYFVCMVTLVPGLMAMQSSHLSVEEYTQVLATGDWRQVVKATKELGDDSKSSPLYLTLNVYTDDLCVKGSLPWLNDEDKEQEYKEALLEFMIHRVLAPVMSSTNCEQAVVTNAFVAIDALVGGVELVDAKSVKFSGILHDGVPYIKRHDTAVLPNTTAMSIKKAICKVQKLDESRYINKDVFIGYENPSSIDAIIDQVTSSVLPQADTLTCDDFTLTGTSIDPLVPTITDGDQSRLLQPVVRSPNFGKWCFALGGGVLLCLAIYKKYHRTTNSIEQKNVPDIPKKTSATSGVTAGK